MEVSERTLLLERRNFSNSPSGLSILFTIICIVDVFGVFPIVALPKAVIDCGLTGVLLVIVVCSLQIYTAALLGRCWIIAEEIEPVIQRKNRYPYAALAEFTCGRRLSQFVTVLMDLAIFGAGIPNLILSSQILQFLGWKLTDKVFDLSFCYWMIILGLLMCPFLWLGSPKDMKLLCSTSVCLVFSVFVLIFGSIIADSTENITVTKLKKTSLWQNLITAYGIVTFQFDIHPTILTILMDMKDKMEINKAVIGGFLVSLGLFALTSISIYVQYGTQVGTHILEVLPSTTFVHSAATLVAIQLILSSAISNSALYQHLEDYMGIPRELNYRRCILRSVLAVLSILIAESVPSFDIVMSLLGGALTGPLVFVLPPIFYIQILRIKEDHANNLQLETIRNIAFDDSRTYEDRMIYDPKLKSKKAPEILFCSLIILVGSSATLVTTYWNLIISVEYNTFTPPCVITVYNNTV
ncbi:hypothetical protein FQA39_LY05170 [Lamprigera yunnana]|nr:hypothetical protein FQA39_LY05170 [Lamprigera yunnana]